MEFNQTQISGFEASYRGMRNPKNSWNRSDSRFGIVSWKEAITTAYDIAKEWIRENNNKTEDEYWNWLLNQGILTQNDSLTSAEIAFIGPKDMKLAKNLVMAGSEHRKFLRQIHVSVDITAPLFIWKELDTYKIGTTANSTSTMHTLTNNEITLQNFEIGDYNPELVTESSTFDKQSLWTVSDEVKQILNFLNILREKYIETKDKRYWKELIRWLPESWLQTRTWDANYETIMNICHQRANHKLNEWQCFINWAKQLPYADDLIFSAM